MRLVRVTAVLFLISSSGVSAAAPVNDAAGLGLSTCAVFGKEYGTNPEYAEAMWFSWLQGRRWLPMVFRAELRTGN
jgi:hypothetical protein